MKQYLFLAALLCVTSFLYAAEPADPAKLFYDLENKLLAQEIKLDFQITAEGASTAALKGSLKITPDNVGEVDASGTLNGSPVSIHMESDGEYLKQKSAGEDLDVITPAFLNEGLVVGLTRAGLIHNVVLMATGSTPDGVDGTIRDFLKVTDLSGGALEDHEGKSARRIEFKVESLKKMVEEAALWIDEKTSLPYQRTAIIHFDKQDMTVVETYQFH